MHESAEFLLTIGAILLLGLVTNFVGHRTFLPRVTLLLLFGVLISKEGLDIVPASVIGLFEMVTNMALLMLGFLLGGKFTKDSIQKSGRQLLSISICAAVGTAALVMICLSMTGMALPLAIILGCIAAATDPAATAETITDQEHDTPFSDLLLRIVAIDDAWALFIFSIGLAVVEALTGLNGFTSPITKAAYEICGAIILGLVIGFPAAHLTGRLKPSEPVLSEAIGLVFLCGGFAMWLDVSFLIASMVMGATIVNFAKHHEYAFHEIENIESPLMVIFFVLAGASLDVSSIAQMGLIGVVYIIARIIGKFLGAWIGGKVSQASLVEQRWTGFALLPQAGVAIGMALVASNEFPEFRQILLTLVISSTVLFEIVGPICTRIALRQAERFESEQN